MPRPLQIVPVRREDAQHETRAALLQAIVDGVPLPQWLEQLTFAVEQLAPGMIASVLLVEGSRLRLAAAPNLPEGYNRLVDGKPVGEGYGSCGTAAHRRETVIVSDIQNDPLWKNYRDVARRYQLGACWSTPMFDRSRQVVGTFALYYRESRRPRADELALIREFSSLAAVAIEHSRLEERFRDSEGGFRAFVDDLDAIVWESDVERRQFTYVSRRAEQMLGYPVERWHADPGFWESLIHPEDREAAVRAYKQAAADSRDCELEYRVKSMNGSVLWLRDMMYVKGDARSQSKRLRGVMVNISRQREAEEERESLVQRLLKEQTLLHSVVEQMPEAVVIIEAPSGSILIANEKAKMLAGPNAIPWYLTRYGDWPVRHRDGRPCAIEERPLTRSIRDGETVIAQEMAIARGETLVPVALSTAPVRDDRGQIVAGVVIFSDKTRQEHAEMARRLLADAGSALGSSLDPEVAVQSVASLAIRELADWCAVFLGTEDGGVRCAALELRDASKAPLRAELERLLPQPGGVPFHVADVVATGRPRLLTTVAADAFEPGAVRHDLMRVVRALGAASAMSVPLQTHGEIMGSIVFVSAHPERRYTADDLHVAEELGHRAALALENARLYGEAQKAILHREEFLSIAAHELKTPLAGLQLAIDTIEIVLERPEVDLAVIGARAQVARRQMARLVRLIEDLLDVSTIRAGRMQLTREHMDLVESVRTVISRFRDDLGARAVEMLIHAPEPVFGCWDPPRIEQVITNLVSNAIKYGEKRPVRLVVQAKDGRAVLRVEDQGMGMAAEVRRRLFRPFERGVAPGHYGGLGLGLYITAQIVHAHGGTISVDSKPREGSIFIVELPREDRA